MICPACGANAPVYHTDTDRYSGDVTTKYRCHCGRVSLAVAPKASVGATFFETEPTGECEKCGGSGEMMEVNCNSGVHTEVHSTCDECDGDGAMPSESDESLRARAIEAATLSGCTVDPGSLLGAGTGDELDMAADAFGIKRKNVCPF